MSHGGVSSHPYPLSAQICATCILVIRHFHRLSWVQPLKEELQSKGSILGANAACCGPPGGKGHNLGTRSSGSCEMRESEGKRRSRCWSGLDQQPPMGFVYFIPLCPQTPFPDTVFHWMKRNLSGSQAPPKELPNPPAPGPPILCILPSPWGGSQIITSADLASSPSWRQAVAPKALFSQQFPLLPWFSVMPSQHWLSKNILPW